MENKELIQLQNDPMGQAIYDYYNGNKVGKLRVLSSQFDEDEIPVEELFRDFDSMPYIEQVALTMSEGSILDVGAGSGCHSLALKKMGKQSKAIDISPISVAIMKDQGIDAKQINLYDESFTEQFDTMLFLMNGSGIIGTLENMGNFFNRVRKMLKPGGMILMDSSDLRYLFEEEDGSYMIDLADGYYGQVDFQMAYKECMGEPFDWLYIDFDTLAYYAEQNGFKAEIVAEGDHYDYLTKLTLKTTL